MMGIRTGKGAGAEAQLRMRGSALDHERGNEAGTEEVGDLAAGKIVAAGVGVEVGRGEGEAGAVTGGEVGVAKTVAADVGAEAEIDGTGAETDGSRRDWEVQLAETGIRADLPRVLPVGWEMFTASSISGMSDLPALNSLSLLRRGMEGPSSACNSVRG